MAKEKQVFELSGTPFREAVKRTFVANPNPDLKRKQGQFYTLGNPFKHPAFYAWATEVGIDCQTIMEPFAGSNSLIDHLVDLNLCNKFVSYDIEPADRRVLKRDTLANFPKDYKVCVTNPPWLAKNSATRRGMRLPDSRYDDLYKFALELCLKNCDYAAVLVPGSFIKSGLFLDRLTDFITLNAKLFNDTDHPIGLALFSPRKSEDVNVWFNGKRLGMLSEIKNRTPKPKSDGVRIVFNVPDGNVGLIALDNTITASIRFCDPEELRDYKVKNTCRAITRIQVEGDVDISRWNQLLNLFRKQTDDTLMTCYRGIRADGCYRRRLDWDLARGIIHNA